MALGLLSACTGGQSVQERNAKAVESNREAEAFFLQWRFALQENRWNEVVEGLSHATRNWLSDMVRASRMDRRQELMDRTFEELVLILTLRVDRRLDPAMDDRLPALMGKFLGESSPIRRSFLKAELGEYQNYGDRVVLGLREAPQVPVFHFKRENGVWHLDMRQTMPLLMRGAESLSRPHGRDKLEQTVWLLKNWAGREVLPEDIQ